MKNSAPFIRVFFGNKSQGGDTKMFKRGGRERASGVAIKDLSQKVLFVDIWV